MSDYFYKHRPVAIGIFVSGTGIGVLSFPPFLRTLLVTYGLLVPMLVSSVSILFGLKHLLSSTLFEQISRLLIHFDVYFMIEYRVSLHDHIFLSKVCKLCASFESLIHFIPL